MPSSPKVSVNIITYNHARFIGQTLDSVLMQRASFDYEIVVGDDCSTDGTTEIIKDYHRRYPDKIKPVFREKNIGAGRNARETLESCRGDYVACVEGDDYWIDRDKLRLQVEYLDQNPGCAVVHHKVEHISWPEGENLGEYPPPRYRVQRAEGRALAMVNFVQACSIMFRRKWLPTLDEQFQELKLGDWPLCVLLSQKGWIGYLDRTMAHYRVHSKNTWNNRPEDYKMRAMEKMAWYLLERVDRSSRDIWKDTILALALKDLALAVKSLAPGKSLDRLRNFVGTSAKFNKPFWLFNRLWPYYKANYLGRSARKPG